MELFNSGKLTILDLAELIEGSEFQGDDFTVPGSTAIIKSEQLEHLINTGAVRIPNKEIIGSHLLIMRGEKKHTIYLVSERKDKAFGLPGGKVEEKETYEAALTRELLEEMNINTMDHLQKLLRQARMYISSVVEEGTLYKCIFFAIIDRSGVLINEKGYREWMIPHALRADKYVKRAYDHMISAGGIPIYDANLPGTDVMIQMGEFHPRFKRRFLEVTTESDIFEESMQDFLNDIDSGTLLGNCFSMTFGYNEVLCYNQSLEVRVPSAIIRSNATNYNLEIVEDCKCKKKRFLSKDWKLMVPDRLEPGILDPLIRSNRAMLLDIVAEYHRKCVNPVKK